MANTEVSQEIQNELVTVESCLLCSSPDPAYLCETEDHVTGAMFKLATCRSCGFVHTSPRPRLEDLARYYPPSYYGEEGKRFHGTLEKIVHWFRTRIADRLNGQFEQAGKALEVGSGRGTLLAELSKRGWEAFGTEFSPTMAEASTNSYGVTVYPTPDLKDCEFEEGMFDIIICYHVLEHLPDPLATLKEMRRILSPKGLLLIAVPNFGGIVAQWTTGMWFAVDAPRHLGHFSPDTLLDALKQAKFKVIKKTTLSLEQDVFGFAQSVMNILGFPYNIFYDLIRSDDAKMRHGGDKKGMSLAKKLAVFLSGGFLSAIGAPVVLFLALIGAGGTLEIRGRISDE